MTDLVVSESLPAQAGSVVVQGAFPAQPSSLIRSIRRAAYWLSLGFVFTIPWENVLEVPGVGTIARLAGVLMAVLWLVPQLLGGTMRAPSAFHITVLGFVGWSGLTMVWSLDPDATLTQFMTLIQLMVFLLVAWDLYRDAAAISSALRAYVLGAWVTVVVVLANYFTSSAVSYEGRVSAGEFNFNTVGMILALGVPVAWYLAREKPNGSSRVRWMSLLYYAYIPAGVFGLALTGTRTAFVALFPAAIYMIWSLSGIRLSRRIFALMALVVAGLTLALLIPEASVQRLGTTINEVQSGDFSSRSEIWVQGLDAFVERPIAGVGAGAFKQAVARGQAAHNTLLSVMTETGIIGLVPFAAAGVMAVRSVARHPRAKRQFWLGVLGGVAVGALSLTWEISKIGWLFLALAVTSAANHRRDRATGRGRHAARRTYLLRAGS